MLFVRTGQEGAVARDDEVMDAVRIQVISRKELFREGTVYLCDEV